MEAALAVLGAWPVPVSLGGDRASFHSPGVFCATWAHEQIHSTGHESRLKRDLGGAFGKPRYAREELVGEMGAVLLGDRLEIGSEIESHAAYLGHWIELLKESPKVHFQVLSEARQAADLICPEFKTQKVNSALNLRATWLIHPILEPGLFHQNRISFHRLLICRLHKASCSIELKGHVGGSPPCYE